jgi:hypothetical protein
MLIELIIPIILIFVVFIASLSLSKAIYNRNKKVEKKDVLILLEALIFSILEFRI